MIDIKNEDGTFKVLLNGEITGVFRNENVAQNFAVSLAAELKPVPVKKKTKKKAKKAKKEKKNDERNMDD